MVADYLLNLLIEQYGPVGMLALVLYRRQRALQSAVIRLAEEQPNVEEEAVRQDLNPGGP